MDTVIRESEAIDADDYIGCEELGGERGSQLHF